MTEEELGKRKTTAIIIKVIWIIIFTIILLLTSKELHRIIKPVFNVSSWEFFVFLTIIYASFCIRKLSGTEHAVKEILGKPYNYADSGLHFVFFIIERLIIYPKIRQRIDVEKQNVLTVPGKITHNGNTEKARDEECSGASVDVDATLYYSWPSGKDLIEAYQRLPRPRQKEKLEKILSDAIIDGIRVAASDKTWRECTHESFSEDILEALEDRPIENASGILNFQVALPKVDPPEDLKDALDKPQIAELEKKSTITTAEGDAEARRKILAALAGDPNGYLYEYLRTLSQMSKDPSAKFYQLPDRLKFSLDGLFDGQAPKTSNDLITKLGGMNGIRQILEQIR